MPRGSHLPGWHPAERRLFNTDSKHYVSSSAADEALDPITSHAKMVDMIGRGKRVLEFGCATGYMSRYLRDAENRVTGIEIDATMAEEARAFCDHVIEVDLDITSLDDILPDAVFDVLAFGDVLEHLRDPWRVLDASRRLLAPGGYVVISIPNIAHGNVRLSLLKGSFEYEEFGLLDNTHLRFFTLRSVRELCLRAGYEVVQTDRTKVALFADSNVIPQVVESDFERKLIDEIRRDPEHDTLQFVLRAEPISDDRRISIALKALAETEMKFSDSTTRIARLQSMLADHVETAERYSEMEIILAERIGEIERLRRELENVHALTERCRVLEATVDAQRIDLEESARNYVDRNAAFAREEELTILLAEQRGESEQRLAEATELRETVGALRADVESRAAQLDRQSAELGDLEQRHALAEKALDELSSERSSLISEIATLRARMDEREADIGRARTEISDGRQTHASVTAALAELRYDYDLLHRKHRDLESERDALIGRCAEIEARAQERESAAVATIASLRTTSGAPVESLTASSTPAAAARSYAVGALDAELQTVSSVHRATVDAFAGFLDSELHMVRAEMAEIDAMIRQIQRSPAWRVKRAIGRFRLSMPGGRARV
jgi:2-polyprenyl-3-methyl-5-hydroxy-6-metoxy-1,4-benzoquinol methylase